MTQVVLVGLALGPLTCLDGGEDDDPAFARGRRLWVEECADCHGLTGNADGSRSKGLKLPAPNFRDPCRRITDAWIERVIVSGGASYGGSDAMRPYHELEYDPKVLGGLVKFVQALRQEGECRDPGAQPPVEAPP